MCNCALSSNVLKCFQYMKKLYQLLRLFALIWQKQQGKLLSISFFLKCFLICIESTRILFKGIGIRDSEYIDIEIDDIHQTSAKFTCSLNLVDTCNAQSLNLSCIIVNKQNLNEENVVFKEQTKK